MLALEKAGCFIFLGLMSLFDIKYKRLPEVSLFLGITAALIVRILYTVLPVSSYIMASFIGLTFIAVSFFTKEEIGYGDGLVILFVGILSGVENLLFVIFQAFLLCAFTGILLLLTAGKKKDLSLPFIPFIFVAFVLLIVFQKYST